MTNIGIKFSKILSSKFTIGIRQTNQILQEVLIRYNHITFLNNYFFVDEQKYLKYRFLDMDHLKNMRSIS